MKRLITALIFTSLCASLSYAQGAPVTGKEWLKVDKKARQQLVTSFIQDMRKEGVTISKDAAFYCKKLDSLYQKKPNLLAEPAWKILKTSMIMQCDWKVEGQDPDTIAKNWLGDKLYLKWKEKWGNCPPAKR